MGATSVTGVGMPGAETQNKGSEHQTLGINHIIDRPDWAAIYTEFPGDGNWNTVSITAGQMVTLNSFFVAFHSSAFYNWQVATSVESALITEEKVLSIIDPSSLIAGITFSDFADPTQAPFIYRGININTFLNPNGGTALIAWEWNNVVLYCFVTIFGIQ